MCRSRRRSSTCCRICSASAALATFSSRTISRWSSTYATTTQIFTNGQHPYTEALLSAVPVPDPAIKRKKLVLQGDVPSPVNPPSGCHFHTRCPYAVARCKVETPLLREIAPGHHVSCHLR